MLSESVTVCRVCGGTDGALFQAGERPYFRCRTCHTVQQELSEQDYLGMNPGYDPGLFLADLPEHDLRAYLGVVDEVAHLRQLCARAGKTPAGLRLLDVGCGMGAYLLAGRDLGMEVQGFEPSESHSRVARDVLGLPVTTAYFTSEACTGRTFDVVILSHVIEHIYRPAPFIADLLTVLDEGGILQITTPNVDSLVARVTGKSWPMLVPLDHVTMLSSRSFRHIVPQDASVSVTTGEYPYEFLATLASVAKSRLRGRPVNVPDKAVADAPHAIRNIGIGGKLLRGTLTVLSAPFHWWARGTQRAACLNAVVRR
jgi:SAM-dependent methyltransferase